MSAKKAALSLGLTVVCMLLAGLCFLVAFRLDNKYTDMGPRGRAGVLAFDSAQLEKPIFLIDGWELYPGLVAPGAFGGQTHQTVYIGAYPDFTSWSGSPWGEGTYRLRLRNSGEPRVVSLQLPEVFSSCAVFADGQQLGAAGSLRPYRPSVRNLTVSFLVEGETELVVQTANFTHYRSGLFYPPILGTPDVVAQLNTRRSTAYAVLCAGSGMVFLMSLGIWFFYRRDKIYFFLGALSAAFAVNMAYPFCFAAGEWAVRLRYLWEDAGRLVVLACAVCFMSVLSGASGLRAYRRYVLPLCAGFCLSGVVVPLLLPLIPGFFPVWGIWVTAGELLWALWMLGCAVWGVYKGRAYSYMLLGISAFYGALLFFEDLSMQFFEPIRFFWGREYGGAVLVGVFSVLTVWRSLQLLRENERLNHSLKEEVERQTTSLSALLHERKHFLSEITHDLKAPITSVRNYIRMIEFENIGVDSELRAYLDAIGRKFEDMNSRVGDLQRFSAEDEVPLHMRPLELCALLTNYYRLNRPDVEVGGADFLLRIPARKCYVQGDPDRLFRMLENLVYNASSFVGDGGCITLSLRRDREWAAIAVADTGPGIHPDDLDRVFGRFYSNRPDGSGTGLGLFIVRSVALEHGGDVFVESEMGQGTTFTVKLPLCKDKTISG